jgi:tetratricopeptide (TPR) repeat protein
VKPRVARHATRGAAPELEPERIVRSRIRSLLLLTLLALVALPAVAAAPGPPPADPLARAAELIDAGQPTEAIALLDARLREGEEPRALLLRSTARFLLGDLDPGEQDLRRSLELDPTQRQGWLNLAALELASKHYDPAYQAFQRAESLDPKAPDNDVNLGATLLFLGRLEDASARFERYLAAQPNSGEAYYLVATNYAASGYASLALRHLTDAIRRDEKTRLRARTDANFSQIALLPDYQKLLMTDLYVPPPGALQASDVVAAPYSDADTRVVSAILDALGALRIPYDRRVEVTPEWALVWADMRIKVRRQAPDQTVIELSAPPASFTPQAFEQRARTLFNRTRAVILSYRSTSERLHLPNSEPLP